MTSDGSERNEETAPLDVNSFKKPYTWMFDAERELAASVPAAPCRFGDEVASRGLVFDKSPPPPIVRASGRDASKN